MLNQLMEANCWTAGQIFLISAEMPLMFSSGAGGYTSKG
jgi:hypothetical protein